MSKTIRSHCAAALAAILLLLLAAACSDTPVLELKIVTPPGPDPLASVDRVRLLVSEPRADNTFEVSDPSALSLEVDLSVESAAGVITLEGLSAGALVARGETPPVILGPAAGSLKLLVARTAALSKLGTTLSGFGGTSMASQLLPGLGILLAGGVDASAAQPSKKAALYDFYQHMVNTLADMPEARSAAVPAYCGSRCAVLALGVGDGGNLAETILAFDGVSWSRFADGLDAAERRTMASGALLGDGTYLVAGGAHLGSTALDTLLLLYPGSASSGPSLTRISARARAARLNPAMAGDGKGAVIMAGGQAAGGAAAEIFTVKAQGTTAITLEGTVPAVLTAACALSDGTFLVAGGRDSQHKLLRDAWRIDPSSARATRYPDALSAGRAGHTILQVDDRVLVVGGWLDSGLAARAELLDATTLKSVATPDATPRQLPRVELLGPGSALVAGGTDLQGVVGTLEVYETGSARK